MDGKREKQTNAVLFFFSEFISMYLVTLTFIGVSQHCVSALTHEQPLFTEPGQLQTNHSEQNVIIDVRKYLSSSDKVQKPL